MSQTEPGNRVEILLAGILNKDAGSNIEPGSRVEAYLKAILERGLGDHLPAVTEADDGDLLGVTGGEWGKVGTASVQPDGFPTLPYPIVKNAKGEYKMGVDILAEKGGEYTHYYVDPVGGSDSSPNTGLTPELAFRTLKKALTTASNRAARIHIKEGSVLWDDGLQGSSYNVKENLVIEGNGCTLIWGAETPGWSEYASVEGAYVCSTSNSKKYSAVVEMSDGNKDPYGLYRPYTAVSSAANLTEGTYFWDSEELKMFVFPRTGADINDIHPLRASQDGVRWNFSPATHDVFLYMKDVTLIGNHYISARTDSAQHPNDTFEAFYDNCTFSHSSAGDMFGLSNCDVVYCIDCLGGYTKNDVFNHNCSSSYMSQDKIRASVYVNLNCLATEAGWYDTSGNTKNLFTAHGGLNILRLNCRGFNSRGPLLADVNGCRSVNEKITVLNNGYSSVSVPASLSFNNVSAWRDGFITLTDVNAGDAARESHKLHTECRTEIIGGNLWDDIDTTNSPEIYVMPG